MAQVGSHGVGADPGALLRRSWECGRWQSRSDTAAPPCSLLLGCCWPGGTGRGQSCRAGQGSSGLGLSPPGPHCCSHRPRTRLSNARHRGHGNYNTVNSVVREELV